MKSFEKLKNVPRKIDKNKNGSYKYPDRIDYQNALKQYAEDNDIDVVDFVDYINKIDDKKYSDFINGSKI